VTPPISVAIPNWNGEQILPQCLESLQTAFAHAGIPEPWDIVITDDQSTDSSEDLVRSRFPGVRFIRLATKSGFGRSANRAVRECRHEHVLLLNNDVLVERDVLLHWQPHFDDPAMFAVATWMLRWDGSTVDSGRRVGVWDKGLLRHWVVEDRGVAAPSLYACGGASIYDRTKFLDIGGFDPLFEPMYTEDFDLSYVAWKRGWKVMYEPRCVVYHYNSYSSSQTFTSRSKALVDTKNHFLFVWKNITAPALVRSHLLWLPWRVGGAPFYGRRLLAVAFLAALRQLGPALRRRREERRHAAVSDEAILALFEPTRDDLAHSPRQGLAGAS